MELKNSLCALLDRIEIGGYVINSISNIDALQGRGIVVVNSAPYLNTCTGSGQPFYSITLPACEYYQSFYYSRYGNKVKSKMVLTVMNDRYHNLNCQTASQYHTQL